MPPKPTPTFCKIPPVYLWLPLALSRCEQAFDVFTGFTGGQFSSSPEILTRSEVCWALCTFFFFALFLFRVFRAAVNILLVPWLHIVKTVYKRIFACKLTNNICVIILVRCCGPHLLFATRLHTSCLGWCRSVRRRTHHVTPRRTRVWRVRRWTTPSQY